MNCRNCGAAMQLFARRRYYFCSHCGSFHFIEGPETAGVRVLAKPAGAVPCPSCESPLTTAILDDEYPIRYCDRCRGVLVPRAHFADAVHRRRAFASGPPVTPEPLDHGEFQRRLTCPSCRARMAVHPYYGPGNIVIDTCDTCDEVWLDSGELQQVTDAPGADRSHPQRVWPDLTPDLPERD
jgi:Zn-finger nucleic acid-binding protein